MITATPAPGATRVVAVTALLLTLCATMTACGSGPQETTCGEVTSDTAAQRVDLLEQLSSDQGKAGDDFRAAAATVKSKAAARLLDLCTAEDDDTRLRDVDGLAD